MALTRDKKQKIEEQMTFRRLIKRNEEEAERPSKSNPLLLFNVLINWFKKVFTN